MNLLGRYAYRLLAFIIKHTPGWNSRRVRVVLISSENEILLIKNWLSNQSWTLPGGGIERGESTESAAVREVKEETTLDILPVDIKTIGTVYSQALKADLVVVRAHMLDTELKPLSWRYKLEIMSRQWHPLNKLPPDMSELTKHMIALALESEN